MTYKICNELGIVKRNYDTVVNIISGLPFRQKDKIRMIEFYSNSRYLNGQKDELGRDKPFYQILNAICDTEDAAKDIDTKDISITSDDANHYVDAFLMSKDVYEWMKESNFAKTLNDIRSAHTRYGSVLAKKCMEKEEDGSRKLEIGLVEWKNVITDQICIEDGTIVEVHYMRPGELLEKIDSGWDEKKTKDIVKKAVKDFPGKRIPIYEVRGSFPKSYIKDVEGKKPSKDDDFTFSYQLYYLAGTPKNDYMNEELTDSSVFSNVLTPLYWEDNTEKVYKYLARKPKAGRSFGVGVMEEGEESQVWTNDTVLKQYRAMEYTTKAIGQSASKKLKGRNLLTEVEDGQILEHEDGKPITPVNLIPAGGLNQYQNLIVQWYQQLERVTSAYAAQRGETPPSGTPFRLQATILNQSSNVFQDLKEDIGIFITEIFTDWIIPHLASQLNKAHILSHEFSPEELTMIDESFATHHANQLAIKAVLSGKIVSAEDYELFKKTASDIVGQTKGTRFIDIPKDYYKNFKPKITVNVTGEQFNKAAILESLSNIMMVYAKNPGIAQDPVLMQIFMRILELSGAGISPVAIMGAIQEQKKIAEQQAIQQPQAQAIPAPQPLSLGANPTVPTA